MHKSMDHKMLISPRDTVFQQSELFEPEGVVIIPGINPSVENIGHYCLNRAVKVLEDLFPNKDVDYRIEVTIQETDNNYFTAEKKVTI